MEQEWKRHELQKIIMFYKTNDSGDSLQVCPKYLYNTLNP
jgi:hypothetical protein